MRYYLTNRPPVPGAIPAGARAVANYAEPTYIDSISKTAHGWAEYDRALTDQEISDYELIPEHNDCAHVQSSIFNWSPSSHNEVARYITGIVLECPYCHGEQIIAPYYGDVAERVKFGEETLIRFQAKCPSCDSVLISRFYHDHFDGDKLLEP